MFKTFLVSAALLLLPAAVAAQMAPAAPGALPKCTAKVQDSCDQSATTEKNAIDYYPADARDAGNFKVGKAAPMIAKKRKTSAKMAKAATETAPAEAPMAADPVK